MPLLGRTLPVTGVKAARIEVELMYFELTGARRKLFCASPAVRGVVVAIRVQHGAVDGPWLTNSAAGMSPEATCLSSWYLSW